MKRKIGRYIDIALAIAGCGLIGWSIVRSYGLMFAFGILTLFYAIVSMMQDEWKKRHES